MSIFKFFSDIHDLIICKNLLIKDYNYCPNIYILIYIHIFIMYRNFSNIYLCFIFSFETESDTIFVLNVRRSRSNFAACCTMCKRICLARCKAKDRKCHICQAWNRSRYKGTSTCEIHRHHRHRVTIKSSATVRPISLLEPLMHVAETHCYAPYALSATRRDARSSLPIHPLRFDRRPCTHNMCRRVA